MTIESNKKIAILFVKYYAIILSNNTNIVDYKLTLIDLYLGLFQ